MAEISLHNVSKVYPGGVPAVRELSLDVAAGELVVLVGPSGCGKSTTLRLIAGLEDLTGGEIRIGGRIVNDLHPKDRDVAMVFQSYALYPHMTVRRNLGFGLRMRKVPKAEVARRVREVAALLGLEALLERRPAALSGGQQQRVALGRAMIRQPAVFLFDEPLSNLDAKLRVEMRAEIKSLQRRTGTTTIHVTHDQEEAMTLGDRVVVMSEGRVQQLGAPLDVYRQPANRFVASFIGQPAMNLLEGRIEVEDDAVLFREEGDGGAAGNRLALPANWATRLAGRAGEAVVLGLRPGSLRLGPGGGSVGESALDVNVELVELLGDEVGLVGATPAGRSLVARMPLGRNVPVAGPARLRFDPARLHFFAPGPFGPRLGDRNGEGGADAPA